MFLKRPLAASYKMSVFRMKYRHFAFQGRLNPPAHLLDYLAWPTE
jgi:hypothetical protein